MNNALPKIWVVLRFRSPRRARFVTLLPEPDSPTMPSVSPRLSVNDRWSTALTTPSGVGNWTLEVVDLEQDARRGVAHW